MLSKNHICLAIILALFCLIGTNAQSQEQTVDARTKDQLKVIMAHLLDTLYVSPEIGKQLGLQLQAKFESGAYKDVATPTQLAEALTRDLRELSKDLHLRVRYAPATGESETILTPQEWEIKKSSMFPRDSSAPQPGSPPSGGPERNARMANQLLQANYHFREAKYLSGNIGYLKLDVMSALQDVARSSDTPKAVVDRDKEQLKRETPAGTQPQSQLLAETPNQKAADDSAIAKELNTYLEQAAASDEFSGAVLIARNGQPIFKKAYGLANKAANTPNNTDTKFNIGSMNKMFTAVAIAQLAERGKLSFNDTVGKLLPDYPNKAVAEKVTVHHLLTHTSGMGNYQNETYSANLDKMKTVADLLPLFANEPLAFEPGTILVYSNSGFVVLGSIIERVSGQNYFDYVKEHIFKPAGMVNTDSYEKGKNVPNMAIGYMRMNDKGMPDPSLPLRENTSVRPAKASPAGGGYSTVEDMLRFSLALRGNKLLSKKYTEIVTTGKVEVAGPDRKYAYGFGDNVIDARHIVGHNGGGPGIGANFDMFPEIGYTAVILSNFSPPAMMPVVKKLRDLIPTNSPSASNVPQGSRAVQQGQEPSLSQAEQEVRKLEREWLDAYERRDADAMNRIVADKFVITHINGAMQTKAEILADLKAPRESPGPSSTFSTEDVQSRAYGDTVILIGRVIQRSERDGQMRIMQSRYTDTYVKQQGRWQVVASHLTRIPQQ